MRMTDGWKEKDTYMRFYDSAILSIVIAGDAGHIFPPFTPPSLTFSPRISSHVRVYIFFGPSNGMQPRKRAQTRGLFLPELVHGHNNSQYFSLK